MSYADRETGTDARPIEIYDIEIPGEAYRLTSHDEDVTFGGGLYTAVSISRSQTTLAQVGKVREVTVTLSRGHELAESLLGNGIPPIEALVTIRRYHEGDSEARQIWLGRISGTSCDQRHMCLRVPSRSDEIFDRGLPVLVAQRACPHMLYDTGCGIDENSFKISPTVSSISTDGLTIAVSSISGNPDGWADDGKASDPATGETRSVLSQIGTTIVIDAPFRDLDTGDTLDVFAGCDHSLGGSGGCLPKFNNVENFGGEPLLPVRNPGSPIGFGVLAE